MRLRTAARKEDLVTRWVAVGPQGRRQPVVPIKAPDGHLYWCRSVPWRPHKGVSQVEAEILDRVGWRNELVSEEEE